MTPWIESRTDSGSAGGPHRRAWCRRAAAALASLRGWRRPAAALALGALAAAAQAPLLLLPALIGAFAGLLWLLAGAPGALRRWFDGLVFGIGYFAAGLYWIPLASRNDANELPFLLPSITAGLVLILALFVAAAAVAAGRRPLRPAGALAFAGAFTLFEWLRGWIFTGFAWNPVGNIWVEVLPMMQAAAWFGVYGLTFATVYAAAGLACLASTARGGRAAALSGVLMLAGFAAAGLVRLDGAPAGGAGVELRIVQPHVPAGGEWGAERRLDTLRRLTGTAGDTGPAIVIWPEAALPNMVPTGAAGHPALAGVAPEGGYLIAGAIRVRHEEGERRSQAWTGLIAVDDDARIVAEYEKHHLVPLGEYVPFPGWLGLRRVTHGMFQYTAGPGPALLELPGLPPFAPQICYEIVFPDQVVDREAPRPHWLLSLTNDGWFGESFGPHQHFASARMRAVEEGAALVRAANTGISAVMDAYGRVTHRLDLGERGVIDARLPPPAATETLYSNYGNIVAAIPALLAGLVLAACRLPAAGRRRRLKASPRTHGGGPDAGAQSG